MLKQVAWLLLILLPCRAFAALGDDWFDPAYLEADTLSGGTGFILTPSPEVVPRGNILASIHRYQIKLNYGFWNAFEAGVTADLENYNLWADGSRNQLFFARCSLLNAESHGIGLAVGAEGLGLEDLGLGALGFFPKPSLEHLEFFYAVAGGVLPFYPSLMATLGCGTGAQGGKVFFSLSKVVLPGLLAMAEYDGRYTNLGARILISPRLKLDLDFVATQSLSTSNPLATVLENNIRFGISYSELWP